MRVEPPPEPDDGLDDEVVEALADHLTEALDTYLETHLHGPAGVSPKSILTGITLFHARFLVGIARGVFAEDAGATAIFYEGQIRSFKDALSALSEEEPDAC